ncbi:MAG: Rhomboid family intrarane serine protease [Hyphomicrobiales bacterium]|nr:Rhomboid family intrarane serine protease [Hyphomicrobiales bacterium]
MFNLPNVIVLTIVVLAGVHVAREYWFDPETDAEFLRWLAFVPGRLLFAFNPDAVAAELTRLAGEGAADRLALGQFFLADGRAHTWTLFTYAFLHADWTHLGVNSLWLAAFGAPVASRFGASRFLSFLLVTAIAGALVHFLAHMNDLTPVIGASASVSGAMAAAVRFVFQPGAPLGSAQYGRLPPELAVRQPALTVRGAFRDPRVLQFSLLWFAVNLIIGLVAVPLGISETGVAWEAHAGGFVAGFLLFRFFDRPSSDAYAHDGDDEGASAAN